MEELIKVTVKNDQQLVSARDLHKGLELTTRFSKWVDQNFEEFEEGIDFTSVTTVTVVNNGAKRNLDDYALTLDMAKQLCMMSHSDLGKEYRRYFIELEKKWNDPQEVVKRGYAILQNENARLKIENSEMKPKALFADSVSASKTTILIRDLAKILKQNGIDIGQNRLFEWLRKHGYLISKKGSDYNMPTQRSMDMGLFEISETTISKGDSPVIRKTPKVTGKGQRYFVNKFVGKEDGHESVQN